MNPTQSSTAAGFGCRSAASLTDLSAFNDVGQPHVPPVQGRSPKSALWLGGALIALASLTFAQAQSQSASPFARKKAKQAWETYAEPEVAAPQSSAPQKTYPPIRAAAPAEATMSETTSSSTFEPYATQVHRGATSNAAVPLAPVASKPMGETGTYYPGRSNGAPETGLAYSNSAPQTQSYPAQPTQAQPYQGQAYQGQTSQGGANQGNTYPGQNYQPQAQNRAYGSYGAQNSNRPLPVPAKQSWKDRLGLSNVATMLSGFIKGGVAGTDRNTSTDDGWGEDFIGDAQIRAEVSAITPGGLEYGVGGEIRGQYDKYRRGFGGLVGDCDPSVTGCPSVTSEGIATALRGHTSQFYASGTSDAKEFEYALEGAYVFLRSAYGDVTVGRDDGAAYLFSLGAPTLLAVGASNSSVDYTGLDSVKTVNDASGFSEKIAYVSPRLLGDQIGVGVQIGLSYAPNARACGVDYCVKSNGKDGTGTLAPDLENVFEAGLALDRKFANGFEVEATATYAMAKEDSSLDAFDDLQAFGLGLDLGYYDWKLGGSFLHSNNGLQDGDYTSYDVGLTWKPNKLGVSASYGYAKDKNVDLTSNQAVLGVSYDFDQFRLGTGVQYVDRKVPYNTAGVVTRESEKATALFVEGGFTF